jgi:hypothetical protein
MSFSAGFTGGHAPPVTFPFYPEAGNHSAGGSAGQSATSGYTGPIGLLRPNPVVLDVNFVSVDLATFNGGAHAELWYYMDESDTGDPTEWPITNEVYEVIGDTPVSMYADESGDFNYTARLCIGPFTPPTFLVKVYKEPDRRGLFSISSCMTGHEDEHNCQVDLLELLDCGETTLKLDKNAGTIVLSVTSVPDAFAPHDDNPLSKGLAVLIGRAWNLPDIDWFTLSDPGIRLKVKNKDGEILHESRSRKMDGNFNPIWNEIHMLPNPETWDLKTTTLEFKIEDISEINDMANATIGVVSVPLSSVVEDPNMRAFLSRKDASIRVSHQEPHLPSEMCFSLLEETKPKSWPKSVPKKSWSEDTYPRHIFMMTRGTRGDVQPFVALAIGMAEMYGWLVTICTELRWQDFVKEKCGKVSRGRIRFRPSGGDTEAKMGEKISQWALSQKSEFMQLVILANSEANFFDSSTVFMNLIEEMSLNEPRPVDMLITGLTTIAVAAAIGEFLRIPTAGFILQPTCIPSTDEDWKAVQAIDSHAFGWVDWFEASFFTSHKSLAALKGLTEHNPFVMYNINHIRSWWGLDAQPNTWKYLEERRMPFVIPIMPGTFTRPYDWWDEIVMTDFIFLRDKKKPGGDDSLGEPIDSFLADAKAASANVALMSFSSMPVARAAMLATATKMIEDCDFNLRLIYVGKQQPDTPNKATLEKAEALKAEGRFLEIERADFGKLFKFMQFFIIQGGLGTTVEALRCKKPIAVSGPLLLDQRFWGQVVHDQGVGPPAEEIKKFSTRKVCVKFANDALDPADPAGYQATARGLNWGTEEEDGVKINVDAFKRILEEGEGRMWEEGGD